MSFPTRVTLTWIIAPWLAIALSGCFGVEEANTHLASMDTTLNHVEKDMAATTQQLSDMRKDTAAVTAELAADREKLESITDSMKAMSDAMTELSKLGTDAYQKIMKPLSEKSPDPKTPDAEDLLPPVQQASRNPASSGPVTIANELCLSASAARVLTHATDYSSYSRSTGATLEVGVPLLKMTKSQEVPKVAGNHLDSIVYVELRPLNFGEDKKQLFPRFFLRCVTANSDAKHAKQTCRPLTSQDLSEYGRPGSVSPPFGVSDFESSLELAEDSPRCKPAQTWVSYQLRLTTNAENVAAIKNATPLGGFPIPEETFFRAYYENFFNAWLREL